MFPPFRIAEREKERDSRYSPLFCFSPSFCCSFWLGDLIPLSCHFLSVVFFLLDFFRYLRVLFVISFRSCLFHFSPLYYIYIIKVRITHTFTQYYLYIIHNLLYTLLPLASFGIYNSLSVHGLFQILVCSS